MKFLSLVCVFYKMCPQHRCCHRCHQCPHHQCRSQVAITIIVTRGSPSPLPSLARSLAGRRRHCCRSEVTVTTTVARLPLPSSLLTGRRHHRCRSLIVAVIIANKSPSPSPSLAGHRRHHHRCNSTGDRTAILVTILQHSPSCASSPRPAAKWFTFAEGSACSIVHWVQW